MSRARWTCALLLLAALAALAVLLLVRRDEPVYGTSCSTDEECERQDGGVRIVGGALSRPAG